MSSTPRFSVIAAALLFSVSFAGGQGPDPSVVAAKIADWPAPATWSPDRASGGLSTMNAVTSPLPFIGLAPCRIVDTRGNGAPIQGGMFTGGSDVRDYAVAGICGIPSVARALSLNFTVVGPTGPGFLVAWPTAGAVPPTAILNFNAGDVRNNAAVVPADGNTSFAVNVSAPTHVVIDINGYYAPAGVDFGNTFLGLNAGNFTMTGDSNTGFGATVLFSLTTGVSNTAFGAGALSINNTGSYNTGSGSNALAHNSSGSDNTADGAFALLQNTFGGGNTATGSRALYVNTLGNLNTATGVNALFLNTEGTENTAVGGFALQNTTGSTNIGIGYQAGMSLTTGSSNICIGNLGVAGESNTIRIGTPGPQAATFLAGINGVAVTGVPVLVSSSGQLGVASSSRHVKENIREISEESDGLMKLRPVAFRYKQEIDPAGLAQYGLIAEEVADVYPDLVAYDRDGRPETVRYQLVNALVLSEVQKQHRTAEAQEKTIEQQKAEIEGLKGRLNRLEARLFADSRP